MFANFLIGLREGLEAALIVGILVACLTKSGRRDQLPKLWTGVALAVVVSLGFGAVLTFGPNSLSFQAQELIGGTLSLIAVGFVTWMIVWMATAARSITGELHTKVSSAMASGSGIGLVAVAAIAVGREGLETALFVWAAAKASGSNTQPLFGALIGLGTAVAAGIAIHKGAVKLNLRKFFRYSGLALIVVAAGVLSYGIHDLQEAEFLPGLRSIAFDVSAQIPPSSWFGTLLKGTVNFSPVTTWLELLAWVTYIVTVGTTFVRRTRSTATPRSTATATRTAPIQPNTPAPLTTGQKVTP
jgi:high-affinity iron transporter